MEFHFQVRRVVVVVAVVVVVVVVVVVSNCCCQCFKFAECSVYSVVELGLEPRQMNWL